MCVIIAEHLLARRANARIVIIESYHIQASEPFAYYDGVVRKAITI
jgi:hypothetical protein